MSRPRPAEAAGWAQVPETPHAGQPPVLSSRDADWLDAALAALRSGGIVGLPTETVYGVAVVPRHEALAALVAAKQRPEEKGIPVLIDDLEQVAGLVDVGDVARRLAGRFWPGPLTLVLPLSRPDLAPAMLTGGRSTLAVRLPDHAVPRAIARELGPLAVSSANRSGQPEARTSAQLLEALGPSLALVVDDGPVRGGVAVQRPRGGPRGSLRPAPRGRPLARAPLGRAWRRRRPERAPRGGSRPRAPPGWRTRSRPGDDQVSAARGAARVHWPTRRPRAAERA